MSIRISRWIHVLIHVVEVRIKSFRMDGSSTSHDKRMVGDPMVGRTAVRPDTCIIDLLEPFGSPSIASLFRERHRSTYEILYRHLDPWSKDRSMQTGTCVHTYDRSSMRTRSHPSSWCPARIRTNKRPKRCVRRRSRRKEDAEERTWAWFFSLPPSETLEELRDRISSVSAFDRLLATSVLEIGLPGTLAALVGLVLGIQPLQSLRWDAQDLFLSLFTAAPLIVADFALSTRRDENVDELEKGTIETIGVNDMIPPLGSIPVQNRKVDPSMWEKALDTVSFKDAMNKYPSWYRTEFMLLENLSAAGVFCTIAGAALAQEAFYRGSIFVGITQWASDRLLEAGMLDLGGMVTISDVQEFPFAAVMLGVVVTMFSEGFRFNLRVGQDGDLEEELAEEELEPYELRKCFEDAAASSSHEFVLLAYERMRQASVEKGDIEYFWQKVIHAASQLGLYDRVLRLVDEMEFSGGICDEFIADRAAIAAANTKRWEKAIQIVERERVEGRTLTPAQILALFYSCQQSGQWKLALDLANILIESDSLPSGSEDAAAWLSILSWIMGLYQGVGETSKAEIVRQKLDRLLDQQNTMTVTLEDENEPVSWSPASLYSLRCTLYGLLCTFQWIATGNLLAPIATKLVSDSVAYWSIYHHPDAGKDRIPS